MAATRTLIRTLINGKLSYAREDETIADVARMLASDNVGAVPVCVRNGNIKGMITDRDIVVDVIAAGKDPARTLARDIAHGYPVTVAAEATAEEAIRQMADHKVRRIPVVEDGSCIGVISQADIARCMPPGETGMLVARISTD
jgi:CBS domain-containing protein